MRLAQDYDMWLRLAALGPLAYVPEVVLDYRQTEGSMSSATHVTRREDLVCRFRAMSAPTNPAALRTVGRHMHRHHELHRAADRLAIAGSALRANQFRDAAAEIPRAGRSLIEGALALIPGSALPRRRLARLARQHLTVSASAAEVRFPADRSPHRRHRRWGAVAGRPCRLRLRVRPRALRHGAGRTGARAGPWYAGRSNGSARRHRQPDRRRPGPHSPLRGPPARTGGSKLGPPIHRRTRRTARPTPPSSSISVAVCTRDRPEQLRRCLTALTRQLLPASIVVVDNAPSSDATRRLVTDEFPSIAYAVEPQARPRPRSQPRHLGLRHRPAGVHGRRRRARPDVDDRRSAPPSTRSRISTH